MINSGVAKNSKGEVINTFMQFGQMDPCGCFSFGDCPCCHIALNNCEGEKVFFWVEGIEMKSGLEDEFKEACKACKGAENKK